MLAIDIGSNMTSIGAGRLSTNRRFKGRARRFRLKNVLRLLKERYIVDS
jgi:hypothetical protein